MMGQADATFSTLFNLLWLVFWLAVIRKCDHGQGRYENLN
jgi:hypothetical protein